jgi:hypothetical protein
VLQPHDLVPHFDVRTISGDAFSYRSIWQRNNLVLLVLDDETAAGSYAAEISAHTRAFEDRESLCVMTRDQVPGVPVPGVLIADRWGEIAHIDRGVPVVSALLEWLDHLEHRCPECEGEAR